MIRLFFVLSECFAFDQTPDQDVCQSFHPTSFVIMRRAARAAQSGSVLTVLLRKEVIQPLVLERLPCYDFTPIIEPTFGRALLMVRLRTSGVPDSHGVTGGVYKIRNVFTAAC